MATIASSELKTGTDFRGTSVRLLTQMWPWVFLFTLIVFFSFAGTGFFSVRSFGSILTNTTLIMLMAIGQTYVIITAGIDLSIGWTVGLASVFAAILMRDLAGSIGVYQAIILAIFGGLTISLIPGLVNGLLITKTRIPPFIATIGMFGVVRGLALLLTDGQNVIGNIPADVREVLRMVGNGSLLYRLPGEGFSWFAQPENLDAADLRVLERLMPYPVLIVAVIAIFFAFLLSRTQFGRHTYVIGDNPEAARRAGINVDRHLIYVYMLAALCAGMAGVLHVFRFTAGSPVVGEPVLLDSVAAVVIGGTSLFGGEGRISGTIVGALIIGVVKSGLVSMGVDSVWQFIIVGAIIIFAVLVNQAQEYIEKQQEKRIDE
jgi:ribose/xylose/arabinose/galactoside ABC-type transport system permease subunit